MTNFERWQYWCKDLPSPQSYVDWGWYHLIGACLQRRVWCSATGQPCFPNKFTILTGRPGIGKGLVIKEVTSFMTHWKQEDVLKDAGKVGSSQEEKVRSETLAQLELDAAREREYQGTTKQATELAKPLLFPMAADATSYQALILAIGDCYRRINYVDKNNKLQVYGHSSISFALPELSSLFRSKTEDVINFLLGLYDCPDDYEYRTVSREKDKIRRGCVNFFAGTTPSFMRSTFDGRLADEGFTSRTFFIFAAKNRFSRFFIPDRNEQQVQCRLELLQHLRNLAMLFGKVEVDPETVAYLEDWWQKFEQNWTQRSNKSPQMIPYYSRKNIHVMKLAMAMHFGESVIMHIPLQRFKDAIEFLDNEEKSMHLAITLEGDNPQSRAIRRILDLLATGRKNFVELFIELQPYVGPSRKAAEEILDFLVDTNQIARESEHDPVTDTDTLYWRLR